MSQFTITWPRIPKIGTQDAFINCYVTSKSQLSRFYRLLVKFKSILICQNSRTKPIVLRARAKSQLHFPEKRLAETKLTRMYISLNVHLQKLIFLQTYFPELHLPQFAFGRNYISAKTYFSAFTHARIYIWPKLHFPKNFFPEIMHSSPKFRYW